MTVFGTCRVGSVFSGRGTTTYRPSRGCVKLIDRPLPVCTRSGSLDAMIPCDAVLVWVWEYLDGAASPRTVRLIDMHLACCPGCHAQYTFQQAFVRCLRQVVRPRSRDDERVS